jgi:PII-like signaling protein
MLNPGPAKKVTIHINEDTSARKDFLYNEIFAFLLDRGVAGASLIRPESGFGSHHRVHQSHAAGSVGEHLPVRIEFIESPEKVASLMPDLCRMLSDGLIEAHDTIVYKAVAQQEMSA